MRVNVTANWRLMRALEPLLRRSDAARALFVTSNAAHNSPAFMGAYAASKAALDTLARIWAVENAKSSLKVNLLDPGAVGTRMRAQYKPGEDASRLRGPADLGDAFVRLCAPANDRTGETFLFSERRWLDRD